MVTDPELLGDFRATFGDERDDYGAALERHYARLDDASWRTAHVSFYASAHPWEDFAESWAQLMHVHDVVETGASWGVVEAPLDPTDARAWLTTSIIASVARISSRRAGSASSRSSVISPLRWPITAESPADFDR